MKSLVFSILLIPSVAFSASWMAESDIQRANNGLSAQNPIFIKGGKARCERASGETCYDIQQKKPKTHSVQLVREGSWESAVSVEDCSDETDCLSKIDEKSCPDETYSKFHGDLDGDKDLETWCTRRSEVKRLMPDQALIDAVNQKKADEQTRRERLSQAKSAIVQCAKMDTSSVTAKQIADCVKSMAKKMVEDALSLSDL